MSAPGPRRRGFTLAERERALAYLASASPEAAVAAVDRLVASKRISKSEGTGLLRAAMRRREREPRA